GCYRDELRPTGRSARGREHERLVSREDVRSTAQRAFDVGRQRLIGIDGDRCLEILDRANPGEPMFGPVFGVPVAADDFQEFFLLRENRLTGSLLKDVRVTELEPEA